MNVSVARVAQAVEQVEGQVMVDRLNIVLRAIESGMSTARDAEFVREVIGELIKEQEQ